MHRARGFTQHGAIETPGRIDLRQTAIENPEFAAILAEQAFQVAVAVARQVHVANLARMRASA
jgi:hypothetical protein